MLTNAAPGLRAPKNSGDHARLTTNWPPNQANARVFLRSGDLRTSQLLIAMALYSSVHTGANTLGDGVSGGFFKP